MKNLFSLLCLVVLLGVSVNVMGQNSTGALPYPGATHTYTVSPTDGSTYSWKVYKANATTEVTTIPGSGIQSFTPATNTVVIKWATNAAVNDEYIVVVTETITATSCTNSKALPVKITASSFDLTVASSGDKCYTSPVVVGWTGGILATSVTYDHGLATAVYTVTSTGLGATETWSFKPNFTWDQGSITTTSVVVDKDGAITPNGTGVYTITGGNGTATVTVVFDNGNSYDNSSALNAQDYAATLTLSDVASGTGSVEKSDAGAGVNVISLNITRPPTGFITFD